MMAKRISVFLILVLMVGFACYLFYLNPDPITVTYAKHKVWEAPAAIVLITVFILGAAFVGLFAVYLGAKRSVADWVKERAEKVARDHKQLMLRGRSSLALKDFQAAERYFHKIVDADPTNTLAWLLLTDAVEKGVGSNESLKILDQARRHHSDNLELLFRAADLNEKNGNITAAFDNLALVLDSHPDNRAAIERLAAYSEQLGRFDEAARFVQQLIRKSTGEQQEDFQERLAHLEVSAAKKLHEKDESALVAALEDIVQRHRDYPEALDGLATIAKRKEDFNAATKHWTRAFHSSGNPEILVKLSSIWLGANDPDKAISCVKNAVLNAKKDYPAGRLYLIDIYLNLGMIDEAKSEIKSFKDSGFSKSSEALLFLEFLEAKLLAESGNSTDANSKLLAIIESNDLLPNYAATTDRVSMNGQSRRPWRKLRIGREAPSPKLSTP